MQRCSGGTGNPRHRSCSRASVEIVCMPPDRGRKRVRFSSRRNPRSFIFPFLLAVFFFFPLDGRGGGGREMWDGCVLRAKALPINQGPSRHSTEAGWDGFEQKNWGINHQFYALRVEWAMMVVPPFHREYPHRPFAIENHWWGTGRGPFHPGSIRVENRFHRATGSTLKEVGGHVKRCGNV